MDKFLFYSLALLFVGYFLGIIFSQRFLTFVNKIFSTRLYLIAGLIALAALITTYIILEYYSVSEENVWSSFWVSFLSSFFCRGWCCSIYRVDME